MILDMLIIQVLIKFCRKSIDFIKLIGYALENRIYKIHSDIRNAGGANDFRGYG